jgi:hypothetical protein
MTDTDDRTLNAVDTFVKSIAYSSKEARTALVLTMAVTHAVDAFPITPHFIVTSDQPKTGKSVMSAYIPLMLAFNAWKVGRNTTEAALIHKFMADEKPTLIGDDISKVFGEAGENGKTSKLYQLLIDAVSKIATVSLSRGSVTRDFPSHTVAFLNGLHKAVPDDLKTRAVRVKAEKRPKGVKLASALSPGTQARGAALYKPLHVWVRSNVELLEWFALNGLRKVHPKLIDREADVWGPLFAVAHAAGGEWPERCLSAFIALALDSSDQPVVLPDEQLTLDAAQIILDNNLATSGRVFTAELISELKLFPAKGYDYAEMADLDLAQMLEQAFGPSMPIKGKTMTGEQASGQGRLTQPILAEAHAIKKRVMPEPEVDETEDYLDRELKLVTS